MSLHKSKLFIGVFVLLAYIGIGIFGLFSFNHMTGTPMTNCPYAQNTSSVCKNSIDHINDWRKFSNATFSSLFVFSLLILGLILYFYDKLNFLKQRQYFYRWKYYLYSEKLYTYKQEITKWLSLFENSPSLSYARRS